MISRNRIFTPQPPSYKANKILDIMPNSKT